MAINLKTSSSRTETLKPGKKVNQKVKLYARAPAGSQVFVAGTFNNWNPSATRMRRNGDQRYAASIILPAGRYEYKFVVNGEWQLDAENPNWVPNKMGSLNSVLEVPDSRSAEPGTQPL